MTVKNARAKRDHFRGVTKMVDIGLNNAPDRGQREFDPGGVQYRSQGSKTPGKRHPEPSTPEGSRNRRRARVLAAFSRRAARRAHS